MPKNIEKNMYSRLRQGKITQLWYPKIQQIFVFLGILLVQFYIGDVTSYFQFFLVIIVAWF